MASTRIAITGMGLVSPVGLDVASSWSALLVGRSGVARITAFPTEKLRSDIAAEVKGFDAGAWLDAKEQEVQGRVVALTVAAAAEAIAAARLDGVDRTRVGTLLSTGQGAVEIFEQQIERAIARGPRAVSPYFIPGVMLNAPAAFVAMKHRFMGPSFNVASACSTALHSIQTAAQLLVMGDADVMLAGGAEAAIRPNCVAGFGNARALARAYEGDPARASRPFDADRAGFVMGEGAGALVLETEEHARARGADILAFLVGWGSSTDAEHVTRPHPEGLGLRLAMEAALRRAGVPPSAIDYVNPHATSTPAGNLAEYLALRQLLGDRLRDVPVSATKSMIGHLLGGAGAAEAIATVCTLRDQRVHPSINVDRLDPQFDLDVVREARTVTARYALKNSAGFGGHNCALVFERA